MDGPHPPIQLVTIAATPNAICRWWVRPAPSALDQAGMTGPDAPSKLFPTRQWVIVDGTYQPSRSGRRRHQERLPGYPTVVAAYPQRPLRGGQVLGDDPDRDLGQSSFGAGVVAVDGLAGDPACQTLPPPTASAPSPMEVT